MYLRNGTQRFKLAGNRVKAGHGTLSSQCNRFAVEHKILQLDMPVAAGFVGGHPSLDHFLIPFNFRIARLFCPRAAFGFLPYFFFSFLLIFQSARFVILCFQSHALFCSRQVAYSGRSVR